jgi:hypothetical protein
MPYVPPVTVRHALQQRNTDSVAYIIMLMHHPELADGRDRPTSRL